MPTSVTFETAALSTALKKTASVAPKSGTALDKAAGVMIEIDPSTEVALVRATNTEVFYMEWVTTKTASGEASNWRLPAHLMNTLVGNLPIGSGKEVTFTQDNPNFIHMKSGRTQARVNLIVTEYNLYPDWGTFDPSSLTTVENLGIKLSQVEWAAARDNEPPFTGVYMDGESLICTDRYRIATVPCKITLPEPITVPAGILGNLLSNTGEVAVGSDGNQILLMPEDRVQIRATIYGDKYPNVKKFLTSDQPNEMEVNKKDLLEVISRAEAFNGLNRTPTLRLFIGAEEISVRMNNEEVGLFADVVEIPGHATHERQEFRFTPKNLVDSLAAAPSERVTIKYNKEKPVDAFYINGGSGYESWVKPLILSKTT